MSTKERKHPAPPRYDEAFKAGAVRMVTEQGRPSREVAAELGNLLHRHAAQLAESGGRTIAGASRPPKPRDARRLRELEAEIRALRKKLEEKDGVIDILKKSVGILSKPSEDEYPRCILVRPARGASVELCMPTARRSPGERVLTMAGPQTLFAPAEGSGTETPAAEPAPALTPALGLDSLYHLIRPQLSCSRKRIHRLMNEMNISLHTQACLQSHDQLKTRAPHRAQSPCAPLLL